VCDNLLEQQKETDTILKYFGRAGGVAQVVESLCNKCKALSSDPSTTKRKKKDKPHYLKSLQTMVRVNIKWRNIYFTKSMKT
jgi:hypothetical protein